ncbi:MAG TPA: hypothetical protein VK648_02955 [Gemmatimonadaceae bacterium]|nr:hypothetical protein [Gemmatimonadaceae bacterium]
MHVRRIALRTAAFVFAALSFVSPAVLRAADAPAAAARTIILWGASILRLRIPYALPTPLLQEDQVG